MGAAGTEAGWWPGPSLPTQAPACCPWNRTLVP